MPSALTPIDPKPTTGGTVPKVVVPVSHVKPEPPKEPEQKKADTPVAKTEPSNVTQNESDAKPKVKNHNRPK